MKIHIIVEYEGVKYEFQGVGNEETYAALERAQEGVTARNRKRVLMSACDRATRDNVVVKDKWKMRRAPRSK